MAILVAEPNTRTDDPARPSQNKLRSALETTGLVVAPATLLTALLYYFGWASSNAAWIYFGVDQSAIGFSAQDYILRAVRPLFWPLSVLVLFALVALEVDAEIERLRRAQRCCTLIERLPAFLAAGAVPILLAAFLSRQGYAVLGSKPIVTPALFALGTALLSYAATLRRRTHPPAEETEPHRPRTGMPLKFSLAAALLILSVFWTLGDWASDQGWRNAETLGRNLSRQPGVVIHSREALAIDGPGVQVEYTSEASTAYHYTYRGLRLLVRSGGRFFVVPDRWTRSTGLAVVVPESDGIRVDFRAP
jgi:hypothetical protein